MKKRSEAAMAAKELKARLKNELGMNVISARSENYAGGSSVNIEVLDPTPDMLEKAKVIESDYVMGYFNGMEDIYEYTAPRDDNPRVSYVFIRPEYSAEVTEAAKAFCEERGYTEEKFGYSYLYRFALGKPEFWDLYEKGANGYESMLAAVKANDDAAVSEFKAKAEAGEVIRLV